MPELAEVAYYCNQWSPGIGDRVVSVSVHEKARIFRGTDPEELALALTGNVLESCQTHGKQMLFGFEKAWLFLHLGMTGKIEMAPPDYVPAKHDHLVIFQKKQSLVFNDTRMFGRVDYEESASIPESWSALPPEVLSDGFTKELLVAFFQRRRKSLLKPLLLEQKMFPGIGNWMADEILWRCQLQPQTLGGELAAEDIVNLWKITREVAQDAMTFIAPEWGTPPDQWLFNHRWKDGGVCPRCDGPLTREPLRGRTTCWCVTCQEGKPGGKIA